MRRTMGLLFLLVGCAHGQDDLTYGIGDLSACSVYDATAVTERTDEGRAALLTLSLPTPGHRVDAAVEGEAIALTVTPPSGMVTQVITQRTISVPIPSGLAGEIVISCAAP